MSLNLVSFSSCWTFVPMFTFNCVFSFFLLRWVFRSSWCRIPQRCQAFSMWKQQANKLNLDKNDQEKKPQNLVAPLTLMIFFFKRFSVGCCQRNGFSFVSMSTPTFWCTKDFLNKQKINLKRVKKLQKSKKNNSKNLEFNSQHLFSKFDI